MLAVIVIASFVCLHLVATVERQVHHGEVMIQRAEPRMSVTHTGQLQWVVSLFRAIRTSPSKVVHFHPCSHRLALRSSPSQLPLQFASVVYVYSRPAETRVNTDQVS